MKDMQENDVFVDSIDSIESIPVSLESLNQLHIIMNDSDCSNSFFDDVCSYLSSQGLNFDITRNCIDIDEDDYTVITLDQQYNSGYGSLIFAPYDNARLGDSDSLALSMMTAMKQNGLVIDDIVSGKVGFRKDESGNISTVIPTEAEEKIDPGNSTSFVTISLGTEDDSAEMIGKSILNGLMRQQYYLEHFDNHTDLLYRSDAGEAVPIVAEYFGSTVEDLAAFNLLNDLSVLEAQTIINPYVREIPSFNHTIQFQVNYEKSKSL